ncbi:MAG: hypothetical protein KF894_03215 [Labilithrix sp.]|nr:hypothetical protein [Labilithrix sp.]
MAYKAWALALCVLLGSPACAADDGDEASFDYGRDEMRSTIEGTWEGSSRSADGTEGPALTLTLTYTEPETKPLCANRTLAREGAYADAVAPRCISRSSVNVAGTLNGPLASSDVSVRGTFSVFSLRFDERGTLDANVAGRRLSAELANGTLDGNVVDERGAVAFAFSAKRRP